MSMVSLDRFARFSYRRHYGRMLNVLLSPMNRLGRATFSSGGFSKTRKGLRARRSAPDSILLEVFPKKSFERCYF